MVEQSLEELRSRLGAMDGKILSLVSERQKLAEQIGQIKSRSRMATRDFAQEKEVVERARAVARDLGIPSGLAEELMRLLIRYSLSHQEQQRVVEQAGGSGQRVLVIGGAGRMGRWFARFLASQGFEVETADPAGPVAGFSHWDDWTESPLDHDVILVATPLGATRRILSELAVRKPRGLIMDIGSLKSPLRKPLRRMANEGLKVASIHPMYGPETELLSERHVIFVDLGVPEANRHAREIFGATMAQQVEMDLEDHDRLIAYVLGLSHALNIAFFTALAESGEAAMRLAEMSSTTFDAQLGVSALVAQDNPHLYFEIQSLNDYGTESLSALLYAVERLRSVVRAGDEKGFVALMERGRDYLAERSARARVE